jgi:hypothetical protein
MQAAASCNDAAAMTDEDWRVEVELTSKPAAETLRGAGGGAGELYATARHELSDRAVVTRDGNVLFAYAKTQEAAEAAEQALRELAAGEGIEAKFTLTRWHPVAEEWEDASKPLPSNTTGLVEELAESTVAEQELDDEETELGKETRIPEWEVRITLSSHGEAVALAQRLAAEGLPTQRHWRHLLIGAWNESDANTLADRLRSELGSDGEVSVETTAAFVNKYSRLVWF